MHLFPALLFLYFGSFFGHTQTPAPAATVQVVTEAEAWHHLLPHDRAVYPAIAKAAHITGNVEIATEIDPTGKVTRVNVMSGPPLLRQSALDAVRSWHFTPFLVDGSAVMVHTKMTVSYTATGVFEPRTH